MPENLLSIVRQHVSTHHFDAPELIVPGRRIHPVAIRREAEETAVLQLPRQHGLHYAQRVLVVLLIAVTPAIFRASRATTVFFVSLTATTPSFAFALRPLL